VSVSAEKTKVLARWRGFKWQVILALIVAGPLVLLGACQSKLIYFPRPYGSGTVSEWQRETPGKPLDYVTSQGRQRAFLQGNLNAPRNLWIVCGGNASLALDWSEWLQTHAPKEDAWLLVDYPGYGDCQGAATPGRIRENLKTAVPLAWQKITGSAVPDPHRLRFFGHSLGSAACMIAASEFGIQRGVLLTPFTSTMAMSQHLTGLPLGPLVWHRFDNAARLAELAARGPGEVVILHGSEDEAIPVTMGKTLAAGQKDFVRLVEIPGGRHNSLPVTHASKIAAALRQIGRAPGLCP
jgi:uncharacterized protein